MMMKKIKILIVLFLVFSVVSHAQELQARVTVNSSQIGSAIDKKVFQSLQVQLNNFMNSRKWTSDNYLSYEKIQCNFLLTMGSIIDDNFYSAALTIQVARPVYNSTYIAPLMSFMDKDIQFKFQENQLLEFDENRVSGNDAAQANLTAIFAYYAYMVLGLNYDSFSPKGGDQYFQKAWNIVTNAPDYSDINGWKAFDSRRNRYWLCENFINPKYNLVHDAYYNYYRDGMDNLTTSPEQAQKGLLDALNKLNTINQDFPNLMLMQFFFQGKGAEIANVFLQAPDDVQQKAKALLSKLDIANSSEYNKLK